MKAITCCESLYLDANMQNEDFKILWCLQMKYDTYYTTVVYHEY